MRCFNLYMAFLVGVTAMLLLTSCGGGASSSSTSTSTAAPSSAATATPEKGAAAKGGGNSSGGAGRQKPSEAPSGPTQAARPSPQEVRKAGRAARFLVPQGDNSVPTYGSEAAASDRHAAEDALASYLEARAREDWSTACGYLAASTRSGLERLAKGAGGKLKGCGPILKTFSGAGSGAALANPLTSGLASLRVKGNNGFALWVGKGGQEYAMPMAHENAGWRVTQLAPLPYPPGSEATGP